MQHPLGSNEDGVGTLYHPRVKNYLWSRLTRTVKLQAQFEFWNRKAVELVNTENQDQHVSRFT